MTKNAKPPVACPIHSLLEVLARPWTLHILWTLSNNGPMRFGTLRRSVEGISSRMLAERLRDLERQGFLFRDYQQTIPPSVTYGLTERMKSIDKVLEDLDAVARDWKSVDAGSTQTRRQDAKHESSSKRERAAQTRKSLRTQKQRRA